MTASEWTSGLLFLPDEKGSVRMQPGFGVVSHAGETPFPQVAARVMQAPIEDGPTVLAVRSRLISELNAGMTESWRGALAAALLIDTWPSETNLAIRWINRDSSAFAGLVLGCANIEQLPLVVLERSGITRLLGIADSEYGLIPAASMDDLSAMIPKRLTWYDREKHVFTDPIPHLNQRDRLLLIHRLRTLGASARIFADELQQRDDALSTDETRYQLRMEAALSLFREAEFTGFSLHAEEYRT